MKNTSWGKVLIAFGFDGAGNGGKYRRVQLSLAATWSMNPGLASAGARARRGTWRQ
jgi:hypothetical protein